MLLDEPTTGLDPQARHLVWDRLYRLKQRGVTLVLTTHYMDEAEQLCDRLVVMDKAKIVAEGSPRELIERYSTREVDRAALPGGRPGDARRPARRARRAAGAAARPRPRLLRRRRGGRGRRPPARSPARDRARPPVDARGRVPPADRPQPDRVADMALRRRPRLARRAAHAVPDRPSAGRGGPYEHMLLLYRRTWRGVDLRHVPDAGDVPAAMGVGLGAFVDQADSAALGGVSYLAFLAPGLLVSTVMQTGVVRGDVPDPRRLQLDRPVPRDACDAADARRASRSARSPGPRPGWRWSAAIFFLVMVLFGAVSSPWGVLAIPVATLTGLCFAAPIGAFMSTQRNANAFSNIWRFGVTPLFLFAGHVLSHRPAAEDHPARRVDPAAVARGRPRPRAHAGHRRRGPLKNLIHVVFLVTVSSVGLVLLVRMFRRQLQRTAR